MMRANFSVETSPSRGRIKVGVHRLIGYLDLRTYKDH
jgi:hypothetical protein